MEIIQILFFIVFVFIVSKLIITYIKNENSPIVSTKAQLIKKTRNTNTHTDANGLTSTNETFILKFQLDTRSEMKFTVSRRIFNAMPEYEWGTLTFQGTRFLKFQSSTGIVEK